MDTMDMLAGNEAKIVIVAQSRLARWEQAAAIRYNDAAQQAAYVGDLGLEFAEQMVSKEIIWPA